MKELASRPQQTKRSGIREIMEMAVKTPGCIRLEIGEPNFPTPEHIVEAANKAAREGHTKYTQFAGYPVLREAILQKVLKLNNYRDITADNVVVTPGSTPGLMGIFMALVNPGDEVLVPDPGWPIYANQVTLVGGKPTFYPTRAENDFVPKLDEIEAVITPKTKAIVLCNPSNPTGAVYSSQVVQGIVELARKHDLYVISDEVYEELIFEGAPTTAALFDPERVIGVYSFSKTYSMTGWRVGYVVAQQPFIGLLARSLEPMLSCTAAPNQMAALTALTGSQDCVAEMRESYRHRRDLVCDILKQRGLYQYKPSGAFYVMLDISTTLLDSYDVARTLVTEHKVSCAPGATFGPESGGFLRVSLATAEDALVEGVTRICNFIDSHRF
ncbi:MAG: pyridoxal phosphate-dependent aminotransferase [Chloroflexi bacterium]|uniref:Aminotransferase n=1 Tax=Candidatus Chlorohelix allophototropha TaxID=3003348 RepID=A0A8T7LV08_9CHLR|nr:pyridoxal phosphate-dependent aminotransferase [Chloroflexota bacterium]WJW66585.1 pyridoxal phosphate-dependent aminotransferase [Chloroflexota bacterium L227-S17]